MATTVLHPPTTAPAYRSSLYEWVTTTDHKKIGILYLVNSFIFFFIGGIFALTLRTRLGGPGLHVLHAEVRHNQIFTMHRAVVSCPVILPVLVGVGDYVLPLQVGGP